MSQGIQQNDAVKRNVLENSLEIYGIEKIYLDLKVPKAT